MCSMETARCSLLSGCLVSDGRRVSLKVCYFGWFCHSSPPHRAVAIGQACLGEAPLGRRARRCTAAVALTARTTLTWATLPTPARRSPSVLTRPVVALAHSRCAAMLPAPGPSKVRPRQGWGRGGRGGRGCRKRRRERRRASGFRPSTRPSSVLRGLLRGLALRVSERERGGPTCGSGAPDVQNEKNFSPQPATTGPRCPVT